MQSEKIKIENGQLTVPDNPIIPFIEGTEPDLISGLRQSALLIQQLKLPTMEKERSPGKRYLPVKRLLKQLANGSHRKHLTSFQNILLPSRAR
jgi:hypothetical protein